MGTFGGYTGGQNIPENQRKKFAEQMEQILNLGGMMQFEEISMYGHEMGLLKPVKLYPGGKVHFYYNYFEDDSWESAGFDASKAYFWSNKIGGAEFSDVIMAAYTLYEVYDKNPGFAGINGEIITSSRFVGWLNHILKADFSMEKRFSLWENAENFALERIDKGYEEVLSHSDLMGFIPRGLRYAAGGLEFTDLLYIINGTESLKEWEVKENTYPYDVLKCKRAMESYFAETKENAVETLWELLKQKSEVRRKVSDECLRSIAEFSLMLPARVITYLAAELNKFSFWKIWRELKDQVYRDEQMKYYTPEWLDLWRQQRRIEAIAPVATSDFLRQDEYFTFWDTPDELKQMPNYYVSDDDRLYWWDGSNEVRISEKMDEWLVDLAIQHKTIKDSLNVEPVQTNFLETFLLLIKEIDSYYKNIFPFQNMFYEFLQNSHQKDYLAAVELLRKIADSEENRKAGEIIKYASNWSLASKNVTHNIGRLRLKRYLSVMANEKLRKRYFGF